jgi:hypothetical protein
MKWTTRNIRVKDLESTLHSLSGDDWEVTDVFPVSGQVSFDVVVVAKKKYVPPMPGNYDY